MKREVDSQFCGMTEVRQGEERGSKFCFIASELSVFEPSLEHGRDAS
jgi:hypothetical protein